MVVYSNYSFVNYENAGLLVVHIKSIYNEAVVLVKCVLLWSVPVCQYWFAWL